MQRRLLLLRDSPIYIHERETEKSASAMCASESLYLYRFGTSVDQKDAVHIGNCSFFPAITCIARYSEPTPVSAWLLRAEIEKNVSPLRPRESLENRTSGDLISSNVNCRPLESTLFASQRSPDGDSGNQNVVHFAGGNYSIGIPNRIPIFETANERKSGSVMQFIFIYITPLAESVI